MSADVRSQRIAGPDSHVPRTRAATSFEIRDAVASTVVELVRNEQVDIGLTGGDVIDASLDVLHTGADRLVVVCPKTHPLARKKRVTVAELARSPLVLTASGTSVRTVVDTAFSAAGCTLEVACEPTYMMTAVAMVRGGLGVTILPATAREVLAEPDLVVRPVDDPAFVRSTAWVKKRGRTLPRITEAFIQLFLKRA